MSLRTSDFIHASAVRTPDAEALVFQDRRLSYADLAREVETWSEALLALDIGAGERVAIYLEKRIEAVAAMYGAADAGAVFVPVNPLLKAEQVAYILADCDVRILVTSAERLAALAPALAGCASLHTVIATGQPDQVALPLPCGVRLVAAAELPSPAPPRLPHRRIDSDVAAILYTSGSTGQPKGVVLSHRNMVAGARSVAAYLHNRPEDRILAVLPLSFDYGLSQLSTAFLVGACAVLINYLLPRDIVRMVARERITGLAAVPPLWIQLAQLDWQEGGTLRYLTNSGGAMPRTTVARLRTVLPQAEIYLMYGLTEAFRSTYLPPSELERRPDSIGRAIPNAEVMVVRPDGSQCEPGEPGELVHRGALVALGYWNDAARTAERFRPAPGRDAGLPLPEIAVWSGDTVRMDAEGYLYYIGRSDDMIKVSGYRISPTEVEEVVHGAGGVLEVAAIGLPHPTLGQSIAVVAVALPEAPASVDTVLDACRRELPAYMVPAQVEIRHDSLPRNPNGKIDRKLLQAELAGRQHQTISNSAP
ncbi:MAG: acyl--CoA ligase [Burkholderia sp.]|nr:acyl--CoA ligase [Burkholderia sp.]